MIWKADSITTGRPEAHAIGKEVVLLTQDPGDVQFDLRDRRFITYECTPDGMARLQSRSMNMSARRSGINHAATEDPRHLADFSKNSEKQFSGLG
jgi:hypothetical protein